MFYSALGLILILTIISLPYRAKSKDKDGYFVSSRKLKTTTLSFTIAATTIGGSAIVVSYSLVEKYGIAGIAIDIAGGLGLILLGLTFAKKVRKTKALTLPSILKHSVQPEIYKIISWGLILAEICWIALSFKSLEIMGNFSHSEMLLISLGILAYSMLGGQWSVSKTDIMQFLIIVCGLAYFALFKNSTASLPHLKADLNLAYLSLLMLFSHLIGPDIYSKLLSAENEKTAAKGSVIAGILKIAFSILLIWAIYSGLDLKNINIPLFLIIAAAITSSVDSMLISSTAIVCEDILECTEKSFAAPITVIITLISLVLSLYTSEIITLVSSGYTILLLTISFPVLALFTTGRITPQTFYIPVISFLLVYLLSKNETYAFFVSILAGGIYLAYNKIKSN